MLTPILMVDDLTDPMFAAMARTHFSAQVENAMRRNLPICANISDYGDKQKKIWVYRPLKE